MTNPNNYTYKNYLTEEFYTGENHDYLESFTGDMNFTDPRFLTFRQAFKVGRVVKKGEKKKLKEKPNSEIFGPSRQSI